MQVNPKRYIAVYKDLLVEILYEFYDHLKSEFFISDRIDKLFPDENFYFYQMRSDRDEMQNEWAQIISYIEDNIQCP